MSDYKVAIKIAGELEKSFSGAIKAARSGLKVLGGIGKASATALEVATVALGGLAVAGVKAGIEYEQAFAGVRKTVYATEAEYQQLSNGIRQMAKEMPTSAADIAGVAEAAGQLGIQKDSILGFTETMVMLGDSTNLSADEAATALARFANVTGMSQSNFDRIGSTIVSLGNNFATTESEIVAMGQRIAGAGSQVGMSESQIMSFSAALSSVGIEAEAGGSAFSKLLSNMQLATESGGKSLQQFADVAGMSVEQFSKAFQDDAAGAVDSFIQGLSKCEENGTSAIKVLDDMGLSEVRMRDMLLRAAGASDTFSEALELGSKSWEENVALTKEASQRYQTMGSQLAILKNKATDLGIAFYESVNTPLNDLVSFGGSALDQLSDAFASGGLGGLATAFGDVAAQAVTGLSAAAPALIDAGAGMVESFLTGLNENSGEIASGLSDMAIAAADGILRIAPQMIVVGGKFIAELAKGIISHLPELGAAAKEASSYLMNEIGNAIEAHADALGSGSMNAFAGIVSFLPAVLGGFLALKPVVGVAKSIKSAIGVFKGTGEMQKHAKAFSEATNMMSSSAKNILGIGVGFGIAAAGMWLLADAATKLGQAGSVAQIGMIVMASGIVALLSIAGTMAPKLQAGMQGLLAFGGAVLMAAAGMSLMAFAASKMAAAGPLALAGLAIMTAGMAGMLAIAGALGPALTAGAVGLLAFGAAVIMASVGCLIMVQAATQLAAAGAPAQIAMAALAAGVLVFGAAAGALAPLLMAGAAGLAAFGAALTLVGVAALIGSAALMIISAALPRLVSFGAAGAAAITKLGAAMTVFAAGAALAGAGSAAAALGFGALALAAGAAAVTMKPLGSRMTAIATAVSTISASATTAGAGLALMAASSVSAVSNMKGIANNINPAAEALTTFASAATATAAPMAAFSSTLAMVGAGFIQFGTIVTTTMAAITAAIMTGTQTSVTTVTNGVRQMTAAIASGCAQSLAICQSTASGISAAFHSVNLYGAGVNMMSGLVSGINAMRGSVMAAASSIAAAAASAVNSALKIHSPSRVTMESGQYTGEGFIQGLLQRKKAVEKAAESSLARPVVSDHIQRMTEPRESRTSVFGNTIQAFAGKGGQSQASNSPFGGELSITYNPIYHFEGEAPSKDDLVQAERMSQAEFNRMARQFLKDKGRVSFA